MAISRAAAALGMDAEVVDKTANTTQEAAKGSANGPGGGRLNDPVDFCCNRLLMCCFFTCRSLISHMHTKGDAAGLGERENGAAKAAGEEGAMGSAKVAGGGRSKQLLKIMCH